ncbi:origin recognition complex subunit 4 isoform X2 [Bacillus rossius redtenbacheri]|uniref:origin recognition complex subunit 4 isoform X2 n=1 Tax=Bacillus rossius redtenbacheri TaxID=93214 RepID=UPI002FDE6D94
MNDISEEQILLGIYMVCEKIMLPSAVFRGHENEKTNVLTLLKRTIEFGESNSALIIGPRGSGKTTLVRHALRELRQAPSFDAQALVVRLDGRVHTDDHLALKQITRQLGLEAAVGDKVFRSFAENLTFLLECLKSGGRDTSKCVLFILEEFDLFCGHHNQTLLYNLFDVAQSAQAPVCVLGLTVRLDVVELLEKRVKSRFSHRQVFVLPPADKRAGLASRLGLLGDLLALPDDDGGVRLFDPVFLHCWNGSARQLAGDPETQVVSKLSPQHPFLQASDFTEVYELISRDPLVNLLTGLSLVEICLVISMYHHTDIYDGEPLNFEMVLHRYMKFVSQNPSAEMAQRPVLLKAFEHLQKLEVVVPLVSGGREVLKEFQLHRFLATPDQVKRAVKMMDARLPTDVQQWALSSNH